MLNFEAMPQKTKNLFEHQRLLEKLYNKNQIISRIRTEFEDADVDFIGWFKAAGLTEAFGYDLLTQMALHKRATLPTLVGILMRHMNDDTQATVDMLEKAARADLMHWDPATKAFVVEFTISADVQEEIDKYQFPLPMVVEPRKITHNLENGYLTSTGSVILKKNHHDDDVCLDHLNRMNKIKFKINHDVAFLVRNQWRNLDKPKPNESKEDLERRKRAFDKYDRTAKEVINHLIKYGNEFYLTHKYDKRGRIYCQGYHISYQGSPWNKAIIELADGELVV